ncbi:hypothetical protein WJX84_004801 [Apatococcus fuscideae]|uniref:SAP domain-containing protein n=1 Tax=Apatococcus fuscideae TaxID=2026836 RepID=A0AAW1TFI6_9CHLO
MGKRFTAVSPNKRFTDGATALQDKPLTRIEVHGKNLFYFFGEGEGVVVMHIHFGMSGAFKTLSLPGPEPRETTRLILTNQTMGLTLHLSAMTVAHGGMDLYEARKAKLGPDPLREDADAELLWMRVQGSRKPIGQLLMDQDAVAGLGNIYRAEVLFKAGVHPEQPGNTMDKAAFDRVWRHSVLLLQRGFKTGSILTVDPEEAAKLGSPWTRRYVYNHKACGRCGSAIRTWDMNTRTVYACETCQPLIQGTVVAAERVKAMSAAGPTKVFQSHCAPESAENQSAGQMTVVLLKQALAAKSLPTGGRKQELVARLEAASAAAGPSGSKEETQVVTETVTEAELASEGFAVEQAAPPAGHAPAMPPDVQPGTAALDDVMSAEAAALEKASAGEGRNVEHVALENDQTIVVPSARGGRESKPAKPEGQLDGTFRKRKNGRLSRGSNKKPAV